MLLLFITTESEYYYEGNRIYNVKFAIGIALMITRPRSDSAVSVSSRKNLNWKEATVSKTYGRKAKHYMFDKDGNQWKEPGVGTVMLFKH